MEKTEALSLIRDFTRSMPVSGMGLLYLMEKGSDVVKATSEAEYLAAVDQQIAEARERNHVCLLSRQVSLNLFRIRHPDKGLQLWIVHVLSPFSCQFALILPQNRIFFHSRSALSHDPAYQC